MIALKLVSRYYYRPDNKYYIITEWNPDVRGRDAEGSVQVFNYLNEILW